MTVFEVPECLASRSRSGWCRPPHPPLSYPDVGYIPVLSPILAWSRDQQTLCVVGSGEGALLGLWDMGFAAGGESMVEHQQAEYTKGNRPRVRKSIKGRPLPVMASVGSADAQ